MRERERAIQRQVAMRAAAQAGVASALAQLQQRAGNARLNQLRERLRRGAEAQLPAWLGAQALVQRHLDDGGGDQLESPAIQELASAGTSGPGEPLPHRDAIQRAFGRHDVGGITAHVGGRAEEAAQGMGAVGYASGDQVAFARAPDLRLAAHEAAHVLQQRAGVQLAGGVGRQGDRHERHADAVADRVVRGQSAEDLLDEYGAGGPAAGVQRQVVQRETGDDAELERKLELIRSDARATVPRVHELLHRSVLNPLRHTTGDGEVEQALSRYFGRVRRVIRGTGAAFQWLLDQAREILSRQYHDEYHAALDREIRANTGDETAARIMPWITVQGHRRPAADAAAGDGESEERGAREVPGQAGGRAPAGEEAPAQGAEQGPSGAEQATARRQEGERADLQRTLDNHRDEAVQKLQEELGETITEDDEVLEILRTFRGQVSAALRALPEGQAGTTLDEQVGRLRRSYADAAHRPLEDDLRDNMMDVTGDEEEQALRMIGVGGDSGPAVRRASGDPAERRAAPALDEDDTEAVRALTAAIEALAGEEPTEDDYAEIGRLNRAARSQVGDGFSAAVRAGCGLGLTDLCRHTAGDRPAVLRRLRESCGLAAESAEPAVDAGADRGAIVTELRGRIGPLHTALEQMIAADGEAKRGHVDAVDRAHENLVASARNRGLERGDAVHAVEEAYHAETGHQLRTQLAVAVRGDDTARERIESRVGYRDLGGGEASDGADDQAAIDAVYGRLARRMYTEVSELRDAWITQGGQMADIDRLWGEVHSEGEDSGLDSFGARLERFEAVYRRSNSVPFRDHLRQACDGDAERARQLGRRLGIDLGSAGDADEPASPEEAEGGLDAALQELHDVLEESVVDDQQVLDALRAASARARAAGVATADWPRRYADRFHTGLVAPIRSRVSDPEMRAEALRLIGESENLSAEMLDEAAAAGELTPAQRTALDELVAVAEVVSRNMYEHREAGARMNADAQIYGDYYPRHAEALGSAVPTLAAATQLLSRHYAARGGDLVADLHRHGEATREACRALGLDTGAALGQRALDDAGERLPEDASDDERSYLLAVRPLLDPLLAAINEVPLAARREVNTANQLDPAIEAVDHAWDAVLAWDREQPTLGERRRLAGEAYQRAFGVTLAQHLEHRTEGLTGVVVNRDPRAELGRRLGLDLAGNLAERREVDSLEIDEEDALRDASGELFDEEQAVAEAHRLHRAFGSLHRVTAIMQGTEGGRGRTDAERALIREAHDRLYPNEPVAFMLAARHHGGDLARARSACGVTGRIDRRDAALSLARDGDFEGVYTQVQQASDEERQRMRADGELMAVFREEFNAGQFERLREVLRGAESLDDMVGDRSSGNLFGTDTDGLQDDLRTRARLQWARFRREIEEEATRDGESLAAPERDRRIRVRMNAWASEMSADPDAVDAMCADLATEMESTSNILSSSGGAQVGRVERIMADPTQDDLLDQLEELSDAEKRRLYQDPEFRRRLQENDARTYTEAMAILSGRGTDRAAAAAERGDTGGLLESAAEMSPEEMRVYLESRDAEELSDHDLEGPGSSNRAQHEEMRGEMAAIVGEEDPAAQRRQQLIFRHKWAVLGEAHHVGPHGGHGPLLQKAHDAYNEADPAFDDEARAECARDVEARLQRTLNSHSGGMGVAQLAGRLIRHEDGAESALERWSMEWVDDTDTLESTLEDASDDEVARDWSNVRRLGVHEESFSWVVHEWLEAGGREQGPEFRAFRQFRLDVSAYFVHMLSDGGSNGEAQIAAWTNTMRGRIRDLSDDTIYRAISDLVGPMTAAQKALLNDADRQGRTEHLADMEDLHLDLDEGGLAREFTTSDEREETTALALAQAHNAGIEDQHLSTEELAGIDALRGDFREARREYAEACDEVATWAEYIGAAIVTAVGTVFTGPGGPTLGAAMLTAAAQATVTATLEEAVRGRRYEFVRTGLRDVVVDTIVAGFTHASTAWLGAAVRDFIPRGGFIDRAMLWRQAVSEARPLHWQLADNFLGAVASPVEQIAEDMLAQMGKNIWSGGSNDGVRSGLGALEQCLDGEVQRDFLIALFEGFYETGVGRLPWSQVREFLESGSVGVLRDNAAGQAADAVLGQDETQTDGRELARGMGRAAIASGGSALGAEGRPAAVDDYMAGEEWREIESEVQVPAWLPAEHRHPVMRSTLQRSGVDDAGAVRWALTRRMQGLEAAYQRSGASRLSDRQRRRYLAWVFEEPGQAEERLSMGNAAGNREREARNAENDPSP